MSRHLTPYEVCVRLIGKADVLAHIVRREKATVFGWRHGSNWRAAGDIPSPIHQRRLLTHSNSHGLGLTAEMLIFGATEADIEATLAARDGADDPEPKVAA